MTGRAALLERHGAGRRDASTPERYTNRFKVVRMAPGQSEDFDEGTIFRKWLWPHLKDDWHLVEFVDLEDGPGT